MYRRILVPLDHTALAKETIEHAGNLARDLGAHCHILWVQTTISSQPRGSVYVSAFPFQPPYVVPGHHDDEDSLQRYLEELVEKLFPKVEFTYSIQRGDLVKQTLECAEAWQCDLIVMAQQRLSGLARLLAGPGALEISAQAHCPVLLVSGDFREHPFHSETLHHEICEKTTPHIKLLANAVRCDEIAAKEALPEAVAILLKGLATSRRRGAGLAEIVAELRFHGGGISDIGSFLDGGHSGADLGLVSHIMNEHATESAALLAKDVPDLSQGQALDLLAFLSPIVLTELVRRSDETSVLFQLLREEVGHSESRSEKRGYKVAEKVMS